MILSENRISIFGVMRKLPPPRQYPFRTRSPPFECVGNVLTVKSLRANPFASKPEHKFSNMNRA
jgi:hypothetical protein